jgi:hypothetical protein
VTNADVDSPLYGIVAFFIPVGEGYATSLNSMGKQLEIAGCVVAGNKELDHSHRNGFALQIVPAVQAQS